MCFDQLEEGQKVFFNKYFWRKVNNLVDSSNNPAYAQWQENRKNSQIEVCPFLHSSKKFYWEKSYLEYLNSPIFSTGIPIAENLMNIAYTAGNIFNIVAFVLPASSGFLIGTAVGTIWNLIDCSGTMVLNPLDKKLDRWFVIMNSLSVTQLFLATAVYSVLNFVGIALLGCATTGILVISAGASGFAFAAAMFFSLALEHREVKLHDARIKCLDEIIEKLAGKLNTLSDSEPNREKILIDLLELMKFKWHQQLQLEIHERARRVWSLCAVFMTAIAIVTMVTLILGVSASTCGIAVMVASSAAFLGSALYRHKPKIFDNAARTIKNNVYGFFKSKEKKSAFSPKYTSDDQPNGLETPSVDNLSSAITLRI